MRPFKMVKNAIQSVYCNARFVFGNRILGSNFFQRMYEVSVISKRFIKDFGTLGWQNRYVYGNFN